MTCLKCQHPNDRPRRFCSVCGHAIGQPCRSCGFANETPDRYCGGCGQAVEGDSAVRAGPDAPVATAKRPILVKSSGTAVGDTKQPSLSLSELAELLEWDPPTPVLALLGKVSQDELDGLFAGEAMSS
jgi:hypothetical protein